MRIMVVDDSRITAFQLEDLLRGTSYEIVERCYSGEDAIERYGVVRPDLVTMDILMPGMDGLETTQIIMEQYPDARIVMLSSLAYDDTVDEARRVGAKGFLYKPFKLEQVLSAFENALNEP